MSEHPSMQNIGQWVREITAFPIAMGTSDEKRTELTVFDMYPVALEAADGSLNVTCERELPPEVQGVIEMSQLQQTAFGQARMAAMPTLSGTKQVGGKQWVSFRLPLHLDGLTRNELAAAIWEIWKAQELLALQIYSLKEIETLSAELGSPEAGTETPLGAPPPPSPPPAPSPEAAPVPGPPPAPVPAGRFCSNCGKQAKPEQHFCIVCGSPLEGQS